MAAVLLCLPLRFLWFLHVELLEADDKEWVDEYFDDGEDEEDEEAEAPISGPADDTLLHERHGLTLESMKELAQEAKRVGVMQPHPPPHRDKQAGTLMFQKNSSTGKSRPRAIGFATNEDVRLQKPTVARCPAVKIAYEVSLERPGRVSLCGLRNASFHRCSRWRFQPPQRRHHRQRLSSSMREIRKHPAMMPHSCM